MRIVTIVNNSMRYDERVKRQLEYFSSLGHEVFACGVITEKDPDIPLLPVFENVHYFLIDRRKKNIANWLLAVIPNKVALTLLKLNFKGQLLDKFAVNTSYIPLYLKIRKIKADMYYTNDLDTTAIGYTLSVKFGKKLIYDAHEYYYGQTANTPQYIRNAIQRHEKKIFYSTTYNIAVSDSIANKLAVKYKYKVPIVIRNVGKYIDVQEVGIVGDPIRLLYQSANIDLNGRNLKILIDAVSNISKVHLTIRGGLAGGRIRTLLNYLEKVLPEKNFTILPAVPYDQLITEACQHDIGFILNSPDNENHQLTLPNKIFEYMNAGLAVISFDTLELRKIIDHHDIGAICKEKSDQALATCILDVISNPNKLFEMKKKARVLSKTQYNWIKESQKLKQIFLNN